MDEMDNFRIIKKEFNAEHAEFAEKRILLEKNSAFSAVSAFKSSKKEFNAETAEFAEKRL